MKYPKLFTGKLLMIIFPFLLLSCAKADDKKEISLNNASSSGIELNVFKSSTCSCCQAWVHHIEESGIETNVQNTNVLSELKDEKGIAPNYRSCHTAQSKDGYIFEGHVPAKFIKQYLQNVPGDTFGLSVPAMPVGSPGMEMGDRFMPYQVLLLHNDGTSSIYAEVSTYQKQF